MAPSHPLVDPRQEQTDTDHLSVLSVLHYVIAGLALFGLLGLLAHFLFMNAIFTNPEIWNEAANAAPPTGTPIPPPGPGSTPPPPGLPPGFEQQMETMSGVMRGFYVVVAAFIIAGGVINVLSARFMKARKNRTFSLVVGGINCLSFPLGTALGVFTIVVLLRPSVQMTYSVSDERT